MSLKASLCFFAVVSLFPATWAADICIPVEKFKGATPVYEAIKSVKQPNTMNPMAGCFKNAITLLKSSSGTKEAREVFKNEGVVILYVYGLALTPMIDQRELHALSAKVKTKQYEVSGTSDGIRNAEHADFVKRAQVFVREFNTEMIRLGNQVR